MLTIAISCHPVMIKVRIFKKQEITSGKINNQKMRVWKTKKTRVWVTEVEKNTLEMVRN